MYSPQCCLDSIGAKLAIDTHQNVIVPRKAKNMSSAKTFLPRICVFFSIMKQAKQHPKM